MINDPRNQQKTGTNQDVSLTNTDENMVDKSLEDAAAQGTDKTGVQEDNSLTQLAREDGEIAPDFTDGDESDFEVL